MAFPFLYFSYSTSDKGTQAKYLLSTAHCFYIMIISIASHFVPPQSQKQKIHIRNEKYCQMNKRTEKKAIIFIGLQASGKSTFYRQRLAKDYVHINLDTLHTRNKEKILLEDCLEKGISFAVDNTNPTIEDRARYILRAKACGYRVDGYFFQSVIADCVKRNAARQGKAHVPDKAIVSTSNRLKLPSYAEGFDKLYFIKLEQDEFIIEEWKENL